MSRQAKSMVLTHKLDFSLDAAFTMRGADPQVHARKMSPLPSRTRCKANRRRFGRRNPHIDATSSADLQRGRGDAPVGHPGSRASCCKRLTSLGARTDVATSSTTDTNAFAVLPSSLPQHAKPPFASGVGTRGYLSAKLTATPQYRKSHRWRQERARETRATSTPPPTPSSRCGWRSPPDTPAPPARERSVPPATCHLRPLLRRASVISSTWFPPVAQV